MNDIRFMKELPDMEDRSDLQMQDESDFVTETCVDDEIPSADQVRTNIRCLQQKVTDLLVKQIGKGLRSLQFEGHIKVEMTVQDDAALRSLPFKYLTEIIPMIEERFAQRGFCIDVELDEDMRLDYCVTFVQSSTAVGEESNGESKESPIEVGREGEQEDEEDEENDETEGEAEDEHLRVPILLPSLRCVPSSSNLRVSRVIGNRGNKLESIDDDVSNCSIM